MWVNGRFAGEHAGGYTPFALDISRYVRPGRAATLTVRAWDTSAADTPIGKQVERWYTHSGGIWQPVWLEGRPEAHITRIQVTTTSPDTGAAEFEIGVRRDPHPADEIASFGGATSAGGAENGAAPTYTVRVTSDEGAFPDAEASVTLAGGEAVARLRVVVPDPRLWSPESPHLYDCVVTLTPQLPARDGGVGAPPPHTVEQEEDASGDAGHAVPPARVGDAVRTYFGLRDGGQRALGGQALRVRPAQRGPGLPARGARPGLPPRRPARLPLRRRHPRRRAGGQGPGPEPAALPHQGQRPPLLLLVRPPRRAHDVRPPQL